MKSRVKNVADTIFFCFSVFTCKVSHTSILPKSQHQT